MTLSFNTALRALEQNYQVKEHNLFHYLKKTYCQCVFQ